MLAQIFRYQSQFPQHSSQPYMETNMSGYAGLHLGWEGDFWNLVNIAHVRLVLTFSVCSPAAYTLRVARKRLDG